MNLPFKFFSRKNLLILFGLLIILSFLPVGVYFVQRQQRLKEGRAEREALKIAIIKTDSPGWEIIKGILESEGYNVDIIAKKEIKEGKLSDYEVLVFPGGVTPILYGIDPKLKEEVRNFVSKGGGYIGTCGGALAASKTIEGDIKLEGIGLIDVVAEEHLEWGVRYLNSDASLSYYLHDHLVNKPHGSQTWKIAYRAGPALHKIEGTTQEIDIIGTFAEDLDPDLKNNQVKGAGAIIAAKYGEGRVVVFSPHPEYEEDDHFFYLNAVEWVKPSKVAVSLSIKVLYQQQMYSYEGALIFLLKKDDQTILKETIATDQNGEARLENLNITPGTYDVLIYEPGYLTKNLLEVEIKEGENTIDFSKGGEEYFLIGDFNGDGEVNTLDFSIFVSSYGKKKED